PRSVPAAARGQPARPPRRVHTCRRRCRHHFRQLGGSYMKGDFTRDTFDASRHFSRVLMQQGRVQLDADWNEQAAILLHYLQALAADLIGPHGGPAKEDGTAGDGFRIAVATDDKGNAITNDFAIMRGHYYVDGILCENDSDTTRYTTQADYVLTDDTALKSGT